MRVPDDTQRISIIGATGSGKTQAAKWHLSHRRFDLMPWIIYNYKNDRSLDEIPFVRELPVYELPRRPGVYIVHPRPDQQPEVEHQMWAIWDKENIGVYVDEGYMVGRNNQAFRALLTQGRSKHIPVIINSQRPVWLDTFVFSESDFYQVFRLQHARDRKSVSEFMPGADLEQPLPAYHSWYYDVAQPKLSVLTPVPQNDVIDDTFYRRLRPMEEGRKAVV